MGLISLRADTGMAPTARSFSVLRRGFCFLSRPILASVCRCDIFHRSDDSHFPDTHQKKESLLSELFSPLRFNEKNS